jgi:hypothetical protein
MMVGLVEKGEHAGCSFRVSPRASANDRCSPPGARAQPSQFSDALRRLADSSAYFYSAGENYWFSPIASLN